MRLPQASHRKTPYLLALVQDLIHQTAYRPGPQTPLSQPTSPVRNTLGKEQVPQDLGGLASDASLWDMSGSPEPRRGHSESPRKKGPERKMVFKRLEKGVFHRLGDKGKSISTYSNDSRRRSYNSSRRDTKSYYQNSRLRETEFASEKHHNKRASSRRMEPLSKSEGSAGGHWKSKPKKQKSSIEDDLSQP
ncbi:hypothetical protein Tco_0641629 [Tanacetum coccineum]